MTDTTTNIAEIPVSNVPTAATETPLSFGVADILFNPGVMTALEHFAQQMAKGRSTVPDHLKGSPADCMAIIMQSAKWRMDPYAVGRKTHIVNGTLGYEAQLVNAVVSSSKAIKGRFHYEFKGEGQSLQCRAGAVLAGDKAITWGEWIESAKQTTKNSPLWKTNPSQQLAYLAVKFWARLYTPDVILGVYTPDELESPAEIDMGIAEVIDDAPAPSRTELLKAKAKANKAEADEHQKEQPALELDSPPASSDNDKPTLSKEKILEGFNICESVAEVNEYLDLVKDLPAQTDKVECRKAANARIQLITKKD